ncbi:uncharacterized protein TNCV_809201 [Trichonephila clavipes]|nr:uncharacterized protein TNCV_809201 [Trichonephila clavipes]
MHNRGTTASRLSRYLYAATETRISRVTFQKDFKREGCLPEDLLFASRSRLRTRESIKHGSDSIEIGEACDPEFFLMDDNTRPHRALLVDEFPESKDIRRLDWPVRYPDLNPIEHVWDALRKATATRNSSPRTSQETKKALLT